MLIVLRPSHGCNYLHLSRIRRSILMMVMMIMMVMMMMMACRTLL